MFSGSSYSEFVKLLESIAKSRCKDLYYCPEELTLCQGLATLQNERLSRTESTTQETDQNRRNRTHKTEPVANSSVSKINKTNPRLSAFQFTTLRRHACSIPNFKREFVGRLHSLVHPVANSGLSRRPPNVGLLLAITSPVPSWNHPRPLSTSTAACQQHRRLYVVQDPEAVDLNRVQRRWTIILGQTKKER
ncbi:hypothetical protein LXL04_037608 [Taraxacum kok-saghyz]